MSSFPRGTRAIGALLFFIVTLARSAVSPAAPKADEEAESHIKSGVNLRRAGNDEAALPEFKRAYELSHSPRSAAQLGLCEQALGLWAEAHDHNSEALLATNDAWVKKNRAVLEDQVATAKSHLGRIEVNGEPAGATLSVNGRQIGTLPLVGPLRLTVGHIELELRAPGYEPATHTVELKPGAYERVGMRLTKAPVAAAPALPPSAAEPAGDPGSGEAALTTSAEPASPEPVATPVYKRAWFWGVVGVVVIGGAAAAFLATRGGGDPSTPSVTLPLISN
jgi:hypothetical protein